VRINLGPYSKAITAVVGQALTFATLYYGSNHWVSAAVAIAAALGVYAVPNQAKPPVDGQGKGEPPTRM
jgi:hypothetical protein